MFSIHNALINVNYYFISYLIIYVAFRLYLTFTVSTAFLPLWVRTVIFAVPFFLAFTFPESVTVATDFLEDLKVTPDV